jgi:hypothetical protein
VIPFDAGEVGQDSQSLRSRWSRRVTRQRHTLLNRDTNLLRGRLPEVRQSTTSVLRLRAFRTAPMPRIYLPIEEQLLTGVVIRCVRWPGLTPQSERAHSTQKGWCDFTGVRWKRMGQHDEVKKKEKSGRMTHCQYPELRNTLIVQEHIYQGSKLGHLHSRLGHRY